MKKIISVLLTVFILLCTFSLAVNAADGITFETSNEDISISVTLEKTEFLVSKKINMDIMVKNISDDLLFQHLTSGPSDYWWKVNGELIAEDGTVYGYPYFRVEGTGAATGASCDRGLSSEAMAEEYIWPSECEASYRVLGNSLPTGYYKLRLWVEYTDQYDKVGSEIRTYGINTKTLELVVDIAIKDTLEPTTEPTPDSSTGVTLSVKFDKSEYLVGEPMEMTVTLENNTDIAISYSNTNIERNAPFFVKFPHKEEGSYFFGANELSGNVSVLPAGINKTLEPKDKWEFIIDLNGNYIDPIDHKQKKPQAGEYSGTVYLTNSNFINQNVRVDISTDFTVNIVDELSENANTPKVFTITKTLEDFGIADDEPITEPTTEPSDVTTKPTELDVVNPTAPVPTQPTDVDWVHPTATAPNGFYNNNPVPNPPTDSGSIPAISLALIGASLLIVCSKKKK